MMSNDDSIQGVRNLLSAAGRGEGIDVPDDVQAALADGMVERFVSALSGRPARSRSESHNLYFSEIGHPCRRKLWYNVHTPESAEELDPSAKFKFLYGDLIEELYLALVRLAGHEVTDEQKQVQIYLPRGWQIRGRIDARIDGVLVDVKSASTFSFRNFEQGLPKDTFGYHSQLRGYCHAEGDSSAEFHVIDKTLGNITRLPCKYVPFSETELEELVDAVDRATPPPDRLPLEEEGKSGNLKLGTVCSYCPFKWVCWSDANEGQGLRVFSYSNKPVFLAKVEREPKVPEITRKTSE